MVDSILRVDDIKVSESCARDTLRSEIKFL
jgi:hypothetical protein